MVRSGLLAFLLAFMCVCIYTTHLRAVVRAHAFSVQACLLSSRVRPLRSDLAPVPRATFGLLQLMASTNLSSLHGFSPNLVETVQQKIDAARRGDIGPNTAFWDIWQILADAGVAKKKRLHPKQVLCHTANRGTLGINGHNCHRNGNEIDKVGVDMNQLNEAVAFELCPLEPRKSEQLNFNRKIVKQGKGLLADLNGQEDHLSVGTGHFTAWTRAIIEGCKTPFKHLQDGQGKLSRDRFERKDARMKELLGNGWDWFVLPWQADLAWKDLADLAQRALNSSHGVSSRSTELEVMVTFDESTKDDPEVEFNDVVQMLCMNTPPCAAYMDAVCKLAQQIGGGAGAPTLHFLDRFQKAYGENKNLGMEFVTALVNLSIGKHNPITALKAAIVAANLNSDKVVDGIVKGITKSDINKFSTKALEKSRLTPTKP